MAVYYKLAKYCPRNCTFTDGKRAYETAAAARVDAVAGGKYRISMVAPGGRVDLAPFDVVGPPGLPRRRGYAPGTKPTAAANVMSRRWP